MSTLFEKMKKKIRTFQAQMIRIEDEINRDMSQQAFWLRFYVQFNSYSVACDPEPNETFEMSKISFRLHILNDWQRYL